LNIFFLTRLNPDFSCDRNYFLGKSLKVAAGAAAGSIALEKLGCSPKEMRPEEKPTRLDEIEVRGEKLENVRRRLVKPNIYTWEDVRHVWGVKEI